MGKLYPRLAFQNIRRGRQFYLPYLLTILASCAAFYTVLALNRPEAWPEKTRYGYLSAFMTIGVFVIGLFSLIFLTYTGRFLSKRRQRELGLYNILGMGKSHIALTLGFETLYLALGGIGGGILTGMALQGCVTALLCAMMGMPPMFSTTPSPSAAASAAVVFAFILLFNLLLDLTRVKLQKPVELLRESAVGEREPKARWVLALLGVCSLCAGYAIAIFTRSAFDALAFYFLAVLLVIVGTYCLFTAVSIVVLKLLKHNKGFYYQTNHFISLSGMLYRMKRNAVGLANICILCTMVLVMVSGTLMLYLGCQQGLDDLFPCDAVMTVRYMPQQFGNAGQEQLRQQLAFSLTSQGYDLQPGPEATSLSTSFRVLEDGSFVDVAANPQPFYATAYFTFFDYDSYDHLVGRGAAPRDGLTHIYTTGDLPNGAAALLLHLGAGAEPYTLPLGEPLSAAPRTSTALMYVSDFDYTVVLPQEDLLALMAARDPGEEGRDWTLTWKSYWDLGGEPSAHEEALDNAMTALVAGHDDPDMGYISLSMDCRYSYSEEYYALNSGFFFLGVFLGFLFLLATVLIIYYKQLVEGYEDQTRYHIMRSVGMDKATIRRSVNSQLLVVFFAPLAVTAVHLAFNFPLVSQLLTLFGVRNMGLELLCTLGVFGIFILLYAGVYKLTARAYYKIVG